jgi:hypothetical protein
VSFHARKEMLDDDLSMDDLGLTILNGKILERQRDRATAEWKYRLEGKATDARPVEVVAKFSPTGKLSPRNLRSKLVVITVYAL